MKRKLRLDGFFKVSSGGPRPLSPSCGFAAGCFLFFIKNMGFAMTHGRHTHIGAFVLARVATRRLTWSRLAAEVVPLWLSMVPEAERTLTFRVDGDMADDLKHNANVLADFFDTRRTVRLPVEVEEPLVMALAQLGHADLQLELVRRYGFVGVRLDDAGRLDYASLADLSREFGEAVQELSPVLAGDGCRDRAAKELDDLIAAATAARLTLYGDMDEQTGV